MHPTKYAVAAAAGPPVHTSVARQTQWHEDGGEHRQVLVVRIFQVRTALPMMDIMWDEAIFAGIIMY